MNELFDLDDILIQPSTISYVDSRKEINLFDENGMLPLITAPMDTVVSDKNINLFHQNDIYTVLPRTKVSNSFGTSPKNFIALSLEQFNKYYVHNSHFLSIPNYICIDIANGHMNNLHESIKKAKKIHGNQLILMVGNIADPCTFFNLTKIGVNYVRVGIGNGGGCLTTQNVGVGYPIASLLRTINDMKMNNKKYPKIIADGGMKNYSDIIKSLALGADYIMIGLIFNKALESAGKTLKANKKHIGQEIWTEPGEEVDQYSEETRLAFLNGAKFYKMFRGMSTKEVQKELGNRIIKTSEGITRMQPVEYTLAGWIENFKHYLSSAMSYTNSPSLNDFCGKVKVNRISENSFKRFNK